jgi:hypothetical protein
MRLRSQAASLAAILETNSATADISTKMPLATHHWRKQSREGERPGARTRGRKAAPPSYPLATARSDFLSGNRRRLSRTLYTAGKQQSVPYPRLT